MPAAGRGARAARARIHHRVHPHDLALQVHQRPAAIARVQRGVDLDPHGKLPSLAVPPKEKEAPAAKDREVKPEKAAKPAKSGKPGTYKTRETQAE